MEVPIECLLSSDAFATYISCSEKVCGLCIIM